MTRGPKPKPDPAVLEAEKLSARVRKLEQMLTLENRKRLRVEQQLRNQMREFQMIKEQLNRSQGENKQLKEKLLHDHI